MELPHITVCILTFKRAEMLRRLLLKLALQQCDGKFRFSVLVMDNDRCESAREVCQQVPHEVDYRLRYDMEPEQNIARARNRCLEAVDGQFAAFIDDDELPEDNWLLKLFEAAEEYGADGILGPVQPRFDVPPPAWIL